MLSAYVPAATLTVLPLTAIDALPDGGEGVVSVSNSGACSIGINSGSRTGPTVIHVGHRRGDRHQGGQSFGMNFHAAVFGR